MGRKKMGFLHFYTPHIVDFLPHHTVPFAFYCHFVDIIIYHPTPPIILL